MDNRREGLSFIFGLLAGTIIGASVAIVLAPQSGEETREIIKDRASDYKQKAAALAAEYKEKMAALASDFKDEANEFVVKGKDYYKKACCRKAAQDADAADAADVSIEPLDISNTPAPALNAELNF